jgi:predicted HicB family RNase H-like nuclease
MKRNPGRPVSAPTKPVVTLTLRVSKEFKEKLIAQAEAVDLTLTDYIKALVERDS